MSIYVVMVVVGSLFLYGGAEGLVRGAVSVAALLRISPLIVGLTVVACGTSLPEAVTTMIAQLTGRGDVALGNILGSCVSNIGLALGLTIVIIPLAISSSIKKRELPIMLIVTICFVALVFYGVISRVAGVFLVIGLVGYVVYQVIVSRRQRCEGAVASYSWVVSIAFIIGGGVVIAIGGYMLVDGAIGIARIVGISERVIGLTAVAIGTSLPELMTSIVAASRKNHEISIGNVVGSNILNVLFVGGMVSSISPITFSSGAFYFDAIIMLAFTLLLIVMAFRVEVLSRVKGLVLLFGYCAYIYAIAV